MDKKETQKIREMFDVLDTYLGDTDPHIEEKWTDEEIKKELPLFWICREMCSLLNTNTERQ